MAAYILQKAPTTCVSSGRDVREVADGVFVIVGMGESIYEGWASNQVIISDPAGTVVVDSGFTRRQAVRLRRACKRYAGSPIRWIVNTHDHSDHVFGNALVAAAGTRILAQRQCYERLAALGPSRLQAYRARDARLRRLMHGVQIQLPDATFTDRITLHLRQREVRIVHFGRRVHTAGDSVVYLPDDKLLIASDVIWQGYHPNLEDADLANWQNVLRELQTWRIDHIVPGHGPPRERSTIEVFARYLAAFAEQAPHLMRELGDAEAAMAALQLPGAQDWGLRPLLARNLTLLYGAPERAAFPPR